ncbi:MAG TPA: hypothetical protein VMV69_07350 [Pirellulales bacterium]|nr:hypothetical protein [Pirellulales bacterium]
MRRLFASARRWLRRALAVFSVIGLAGTADNIARGDDNLREWFKTQYLAAVARLDRPLRNLRCRFTASGHDNHGEFEYVGEFFAKDGAREAIRVRQRRNGEPQEEESRVVCMTPARFFQLDRPLGGASYVIRAFDDGNDSNRRRKYKAIIEITTDAFVEAALRMDDPVTMLLTNEGVANVVKMDVAKIDRGGRPYIELRCDFSEASNYERARATLDPDLDFAVCDYEIVIRGTPGARCIRKGLVECERWVGDGYVFPRRVRIEDDTVLPEGEHYWSVQEIEFQEVLLDEVDDSQFSLTAFGIPEIALKLKRGLYPFDRWYFWALIGAAVLGSLYLRRIAGKS